MVGSFVAILAFAVSSDSCFCCYSGGVTIEDFFSYNRLAFSNRKLAQQKQHIFFSEKFRQDICPLDQKRIRYLSFVPGDPCVYCVVSLCVCVCVKRLSPRFSEKRQSPGFPENC